MKNNILKFFVIVFLLNVSLFAQDKIILQLKWLHQFQFAGYYAAKEKGFYKKAGLDVEIKERNLNENYIKKVLENEGYYGVIDSILLLYKSRNKPIVLVSTIFQHSPNILISLKSSKIDSPYKLNNKNMLFYENDTDGFSILALMKKINVKPSLIRKREKNDYKKLLSGEVDVMPAYISNEPFLFKNKKIDINVINPSNYGFDFYGDMVFTSKKELKNNPLRVKKFKEATLKGWEYALNHKEEIINLILKKYAKGKTVKQLRMEANAIEELISIDTVPLGTLDKGRLKYINSLFKEYSSEKINDLNFAHFVFEEDSNLYGFTEEELNYLKDNPTIKVQNLDFFPPYNFIENGKPKGFMVDYLNYIGSLIDVKFDFVKSSTWIDYEKMLKNNEISLIPNIAITKDRKKYISYSDFSYISFAPVLLANKNTNIKNNLKDLNNKIVAVVNNSFLYEIVKKNYPNISLLTVPSSTKAVEMVMEGKADLALGNLATFEYIIQKNWYINLKTLKIVSKSIPSKVNLYMGYLKDNVLLKSILEKVNNKILISKIYELKNKWSKIDSGKNNLILNSKEKDYLKKKQEIKICVDPEWMPIEKIKNNKVIGMSSDYIKYYEKKLNIPFNLVPTKSWTQTLEYLKNRKCDLVPLIFKDKKLRTYLNFTDGHVSFPLVLATRLEEPFVSNVFDTHGKKIGHIKDYAYADALREKYPKINLVEVDSMKDGLEKVKNKTIFGLVGILPSIGYYIQKDYFGDLKISGKFNDEWSFSVGTRNDEPILNSIMSKAIDTISMEEYKKFYENWISVKYQKSIDYRKIITVSFVLVLIILIVLYKNRTINKINEKMKKYLNIIDKNVLATSINTDGNITSVSKAFLKLSHFDKKDLIGEKHCVLNHKDMDKKIFDELWNTIQSGKEWKGEIKNRKKDGGCFWTNTVITPELNNKGKIISYIAIREDITDKKKIEEISITDGLTNIYNRRYFNDIFPKYVNDAKRNNEVITFMIMDVDHFKQYNDNYGHQKGDEVLIEVAKTLKEFSKRAGDYCFRLGGEEFGMVYKSDTVQKAKDFAIEILKGIEGLKIEHKYNIDVNNYITVSIGAHCQHAKDINNIKELYKNTDELLYKAKEGGRNRVSFN